MHLMRPHAPNWGFTLSRCPDYYEHNPCIMHTLARCNNISLSAVCGAFCQRHHVHKSSSTNTHQAPRLLQCAFLRRQHGISGCPRVPYRQVPDVSASASSYKSNRTIIDPIPSTWPFCHENVNSLLLVNAALYAAAVWGGQAWVVAHLSVSASNPHWWVGVHSGELCIYMYAGTMAGAHEAARVACTCTSLICTSMHLGVWLRNKSPHLSIQPSPIPFPLPSHPVSSSLQVAIPDERPGARISCAFRAEHERGVAMWDDDETLADPLRRLANVWAGRAGWVVGGGLRFVATLTCLCPCRGSRLTRCASCNTRLIECVGAPDLIAIQAARCCHSVITHLPHSCTSTQIARAGANISAWRLLPLDAKALGGLLGVGATGGAAGLALMTLVFVLRPKFAFFVFAAAFMLLGGGAPGGAATLALLLVVVFVLRPSPALLVSTAAFMQLALVPLIAVPVPGVSVGNAMSAGVEGWAAWVWGAWQSGGSKGVVQALQGCGANPGLSW